MPSAKTCSDSVITRNLINASARASAALSVHKSRGTRKPPTALTRPSSLRPQHVRIGTDYHAHCYEQRMQHAGAATAAAGTHAADADATPTRAAAGEK